MKEITIDDVELSGGNLLEAIKGVERFVSDNISSVEINRENMSMLSGLVSALVALGKEHKREIEILDNWLTVSCHE